MKNEIIRLRRDESWSIREISTHLRIAKSTVSVTCRGIKPQNPQRLRDKQTQNAIKGSRANSDKARLRKEQKRIQAQQKWETLQHDPMFMMFLGLYWGEGRKTGGNVFIANNDPAIIKLAYNAFLKYWPDSHLKATIKYYKSHNEKVCSKFWNNLLPNANVVTKPVKDKRSKSCYCDRCPFGLCDLGFTNILAFTEILKWLEIMKTNLMNPVTPT